MLHSQVCLFQENHHSISPHTLLGSLHPLPVFPDVGSMIVSPGFKIPAFSASSTILRLMRSFTLPPALKYSHFATGNERGGSIRDKLQPGAPAPCSSSPRCSHLRTPIPPLQDGPLLRGAHPPFAYRVPQPGFVYLQHPEGSGQAW